MTILQWPYEPIRTINFKLCPMEAVVYNKPGQGATLHIRSISGHISVAFNITSLWLSNFDKDHIDRIATIMGSELFDAYDRGYNKHKLETENALSGLKDLLNIH